MCRPTKGDWPKKNPEKVKFGKFSTESENFSEIGGNLKQRGNASWPQSGWTPLLNYTVYTA